MGETGTITAITTATGNITGIGTVVERGNRSGSENQRDRTSRNLQKRYFIIDNKRTCIAPDQSRLLSGTLCVQSNLALQSPQ